MKQSNTISVSYGDGVGPEIMRAVLNILNNARVNLNIDVFNIGSKNYIKGITSGISTKNWESITRNKVILKSPISTPLVSGYKSLNVTLRRGLNLFANITPSVSYHPFVNSFKNTNIIVIRDNEEDLYSGIEYRVSQNSAMGIKLVSNSGCEKIIRYAFEYAKANKNTKVTCATKSNIFKIVDGSFQRIFFQVAREYPDIKAEHALVDTLAGKLIHNPKDYHIIVTLNLYGNIISKMISAISGSIGLVANMNIGQKYALFETSHGTAPGIAGKNIANPSGLLYSAIMMLKYLGEKSKASLIYNAWLRTIQEGLHTADIFDYRRSKAKLSTSDFSEAIIKNLDKNPLSPAEITKLVLISDSIVKNTISNNAISKLIGVDIFIKTSLNIKLVVKLQSIDDTLKLHIISSKGLIVWPKNLGGTKVDFYRFRFLRKRKEDNILQNHLINLYKKIIDLDLSIMLTISLYNYDNKIGSSRAQGE